MVIPRVWLILKLHAPVSQSKHPVFGGEGPVIHKILRDTATEAQEFRSCGMNLLDPLPPDQHIGLAKVPLSDAKRFGEKWECGARDPIRGAMPQPPPRL